MPSSPRMSGYYDQPKSNSLLIDNKATIESKYQSNPSPKQLTLGSRKEEDIPPWLREEKPKPSDMIKSSKEAHQVHSTNKDILKQQIEEKKKAKQREIELQKLEDLKENQKLEKERESLRLQFIQEREAARLKEEQDAQALLKQKNDYKTKKENDAKIESEKSRRISMIEQARNKAKVDNLPAAGESNQVATRSNSPPIPTMMNKMELITRDKNVPITTEEQAQKPAQDLSLNVVTKNSAVAVTSNSQAMKTLADIHRVNRIN